MIRHLSYFWENKNMEKILTKKNLKETLYEIKKQGNFGKLYYLNEVLHTRTGLLLEKLVDLGCLKSEDAGCSDPAMGDVGAVINGSYDMVCFKYINELPRGLNLRSQ